MLYSKKHTLGQPSTLLFFLLCPFILRGQIKVKEDDLSNRAMLERIVKISPLALVDPFSHTLAFYFEQQMPRHKKRESMEYEIGYTYGINGMKNEVSGYRVRTAYRHYFNTKFKNKGNYYGSLALMQRQIFGSGNEFVWRDNRGFQQDLDYSVLISQQTLTLNMGTTQYFGSKKQFNLDMSIGLGVRRTRILFKGMPDDAVTPTIPAIFDSNYGSFISSTTIKDRTHYFHNAVIGIKLGYVLPKKISEIEKQALRKKR